MSATDSFFCHRLVSLRLNDEFEDHVAQVGPVVEPLGEGAEVGLGVVAVNQRFEGALRHKKILRADALLAAKPLRPTRALEVLGALCFSAVVAQKLSDRHAVLELDLWLDISALHRQESPDYELSGSLNEPSEASF